MFWLQSGKQYCEPGKRRTGCGSLTSLLFSVESVICGVKTLKMKEVNYILARAGTIVSGILLFCWLGMLVIGVLSVF